MHTYLEGRLPSAAHCVPLRSLAHSGVLRGSADESANASVIVVDGMALIRKMCPVELEWIVGGQFQEIWANVATFVGTFASQGLSLVVFLDGGVDDAKLSEWRERRLNDYKKVERVVAALRKGEPPAKAAWMPPPNISKVVGGAFAEQGCEVHYTAGEADREIASYCLNRGCAAVLAKDSDFFVLPVPCYLNLDTLQLFVTTPTVTAYRRDAIDGALTLPAALLPLLGSLVGNDFVPTTLLSRWHSSLMPGRHASGSPLIEAVAKHLAAAAAAASWQGPRPTTPLLWCALDFGRRISAHARQLIEVSLEQYEVGPAFEELPVALLQKAAGASTEMVRRFRRGLLDSMIYSAATRGAIWRGPSLDDPEATPTILAARPIRAEVYAACCKPRTKCASLPWAVASFWPEQIKMEVLEVEAAEAAEEGAEVAAGAAEAEAMAESFEVATASDEGEPVPEQPSDEVSRRGHARAADPLRRQASVVVAAAPASDVASDAAHDGVIRVNEHIVYHGQAGLAEAEAVSVPAQLRSCEAMWGLEVPARCACLLEAYARACRHDALACHFDAAALIALGPIGLTLLGVRYMRRHGLAPRPLASALLCQVRLLQMGSDGL